MFGSFSSFIGAPKLPYRIGKYRDLDDSVEHGTRNFKMGLRRLRTFAREGAQQELDLSGTIRANNAVALT